MAKSIDQETLERDLRSASFRLGVRDGRWRLVEIRWPHVFLAVRAAKRSGAPDEFVLRFDCTNYPQAAVTAQPWTPSLSGPLPGNHWPTGTSRVPAAFNSSWKNGICLYLPCDRLAMEGHDPWRQKYPSYLWSPDKGIIKYLEIVHELLNSKDYTGIRSP